VQAAAGMSDPYRMTAIRQGFSHPIAPNARAGFVLVS